jgi:AraC family transcriptional regulator of adaptative response/methylated-DNA-[protein]-cysteine methyltransferase
MLYHGNCMTPESSPLGFDAADEARFRLAFDAATAAHTGATESSIAIDWMASPAGPMVLGATDRAVVLVEFASVDQLDAQFARLHKHFGRPFVKQPNHPWLERLKTQLTEYFAGERRAFEVPLAFDGSDFQVCVWSELREIPYGETRSYGAIARRLGDPNATRAVGLANGQNPLAIVIPCHRVVNSNGDLGGYGGGRWRKQLLLDLEGGQRRLF